MEKVILVNELDVPVGVMEKKEAHRQGLLHRAFSVFLFNSRGEMLLQQRAAGKYHSGGLWSNACCSHPAPGEETQDAVRRRLKEELGIECETEKVFDFIYKTGLDNELTEHEFDHVYAGQYEGPLFPDAGEISDYCYKKMKELKQALADHPRQFTTWFRLAFPVIEDWWLNRYAQLKV